MADQTVQIDVVATVNEAITGMRALQKETADALRKMSSALGGDLPQAAQAASKAHDGLLSKLREFRGEQVQQGRMARFYAGELLSFVPAAQGAKDALQSVLGVLVEGAAGGLSFGLALEGAKLAVELFTASQKEAAAKAKEHADQIKAITDAFEKYEAAARNASATELDFLSVSKADRDNLVKKRRELRDTIDDLSKLEEQRQEMAASGNEHGIGGQMVVIEQAQKKKRQLEEEISELEHRVDAARLRKEEADKQVNIAGAPKAAQRVAGEEAAKAAKRREEERKEELEGMEAEGRRQEEQGKVAAKVAEIRTRWAMKTADEIEQIEIQAGKDLAEIGFENAKVYDEIWQQAEEAKEKIRQKAHAKEEEELVATLEKARAAADYEAAVQKQKFDKMAAQATHALRPLRSAVDSIFDGILEGNLDIAQVMDSLWKGIAKTVIGALLDIAEQAGVAAITQAIIGKAASISTTQGHIAEAVSGAAASQAFIPFVGPGLATAAAGEMLGMLEGMTAPLLSAARGFDIPAGMNPVTQLHAREMVLPAPYADVIRGAAKGGGFGGGSVVINAMDPRSFRDFLRRNDRAVFELLGEGARNGRIA